MITKERLEEIKDSIELQKKLREVVGINYDEILVEEIDLYNEVIELQKRIDKAIEYINNYETIRGYYEYQECGYDEYNYEEDLKEDLSEILKGEPNNE